MFIDETPDNSNKINNEIIQSWRSKLINRVISSKPYCNFLKKSTPLHSKLISTLDDALQINEKEEKYELCAVLFNFKEEISKLNN